MAEGECLKSIRKEKELTQKQLSRITGISRSHIGDIENNRYSPTVKTMRKISDKLNIHIHELIK